ncbi:hypothetical protein E3O48_01685 [Cryobacterium sp. HLT2-28]|nr:hypothetical protein E3O48_01685 [Cryobacterium sp. HLT2-28]
MFPRTVRPGSQVSSRRKPPKAIRCADPFHVAKWATDALDEVRRTAWNDARKAARQHDARCTRCRPAVPAAGPPPTLRPDRIVLELPASRTAATRSGRTRRT